MTMWCRALGLAAVLTTGLFLATTAAGWEMGPPEAYQDLGWEEKTEEVPEEYHKYSVMKGNHCPEVDLIFQKL